MSFLIHSQAKAGNGKRWESEVGTSAAPAVLVLLVVGLLGLLFKPRGLLLTTVGSILAVLLIGQWVNLWRI